MKVVFNNNDNLKKEEIDEQVTRVKALMINSNNEILLGYSYKTYQFPGGHLIEGETIEECLLREIREETGMNLSQTALSEPFLLNKTYVENYMDSGKNRENDIYYFIIDSDLKYDEENTNYDHQEQIGNYQLVKMNLSNIEQILINSIEDNPVNKYIVKEMIEALKEYKENKNLKVNQNNLRMIMSVNVNKFKEKNPLEFINLVKGKIDGIEVYVDFNNEGEMKYLDDLAFLCNVNKLHFQVHGNSLLTIKDQESFLEILDKISKNLGYKINVVLHSLPSDDIQDSLNKTTVYIDELEEYIDEKKLDIILSLENLNSDREFLRLSKDYLYPVFYNNDNLKFTYDLGHEIEEYGELTQLDEIELERINNVHIHTFKNVIDHQPIYEDDENKDKIIKCLSYLKLINYNSSIVFEYDLYAVKGETYEEKINGYIDSMNYVKQYFI